MGNKHVLKFTRWSFYMYVCVLYILYTIQQIIRCITVGKEKPHGYHSSVLEKFGEDNNITLGAKEKKGQSIERGGREHRKHLAFV